MHSIYLPSEFSSPLCLRRYVDATSWVQSVWPPSNINIRKWISDIFQPTFLALGQNHYRRLTHQCGSDLPASRCLSTNHTTFAGQAIGEFSEPLRSAFAFHLKFIRIPWEWQVGYFPPDTRYHLSQHVPFNSCVNCLTWWRVFGCYTTGKYQADFFLSLLFVDNSVSIWWFWNHQASTLQYFLLITYCKSFHRHYHN